MAGAARRGVELLAIDQVAAAPGVEVDENATDRRTPARMRGSGIAVLEMRERFQV